MGKRKPYRANKLGTRWSCNVGHVMFEVKIDIKGTKEISDRLKKLSGKILREAYWEMYRATKEHIERKAKELAPVETGALRNSIITIPEGFGYKDRTVKVIAGGGIVNYAAAQEFGFHFSEEFARHAAWGKGMDIAGVFKPGVHYMSRARDAGAPRVLERVEKRIMEMIK